MKPYTITALLACSLLLATQRLAAQATGSDYRTAIGLKFSPTAITVKHFLKSNAAIEGLGYFWDDGFRLTGLYEWHGDIKGAAGLKWYAGIGGHIDFWNESYRERYTPEGNAALGVDGVVGLDYKFNGAPINLSLDWQPSVTFIGASYADAHWVGLSFRFAF
jgi:hypothetical protein